MTATRLRPHGKAVLATLAIAALAVAILFAMDRPPICTCGEVRLWHGVVQSDGNSQHLTDWYSPSHFTHGLIMYFVAWLLWRKWRLLGGRPARWALPIAVLVEAAWEVVENTPMVIDRYRAVTVSWGYSGDSIVNSAADIGWMIAGFALATERAQRRKKRVGDLVEGGLEPSNVLVALLVVAAERDQVVVVEGHAVGAELGEPVHRLDRVQRGPGGGLVDLGHALQPDHSR